MNTRTKRVFFIGITSVVSLIVLVSLSEILLRILGYRPWQNYRKDANEPRVYEYDNLLGWRNKEGNYTIPPYSRKGTPIKITFLSDGSRVTEEQKNGDRDKFVILGGSFTQGWAISDDETYPWKLQERYPHLEVLNYGSGGYGTYQSLLMLERIFGNSKPPVMVLYGFMWHHEERNVAPPGWIAALSKLTKRRARVAVPYGTINHDGVLIRHPPESYPVWPLREWLAIVPFLQQLYTLPATWRRKASKELVTEKLILEIHNLSTGHGADFAVILLEPRKT